eukprot:6178087-Pleurochrysis_carterae.AAC.3
MQQHALVGNTVHIIHITSSICAVLCIDAEPRHRLARTPLRALKIRSDKRQVAPIDARVHGRSDQRRKDSRAVKSSTVAHAATD